MNTIITLINPGETKEEDEKKQVFAQVKSVGCNEVAATGQLNMKAKYIFIVWVNEYSQETGVLYKGERLTVYRTYELTAKGKIELHTSERAGNI